MARHGNNPAISPWARVRRGLDHVVTRTALSIVIVLSLVPHESVVANDRWFLLVFVPEFVARLGISLRRESTGSGAGWMLPTRGEAFLLLVDLIALASFLPLGSFAARSTRWLRLFRLSRTLMLLRYWGPLLTDARAVIFRRERLRQLMFITVAVGGMSFAGTVMLHHLADQVGADFDGDGVAGDAHDHQFLIRMWWAFRQIEDPGNMLSSPSDAGTLIVSIVLTVMGLFLISVLIGVGADIVAELMRTRRLRPVGMAGHTVVLNVGSSTVRLLHELARSSLASRADVGPKLRRWGRAALTRVVHGRAMVVVGRDESPPDFLHDPALTGIEYRQDSEEDDEVFLDRADVVAAGRIVLLAEDGVADADSFTIRTLLTIVERIRGLDDASGLRKRLIAEVLDESNVDAARRASERASSHLDVQVVPTNRLLAQVMARIARSPEVAKPLLERIAARDDDAESARPDPALLAMGSSRPTVGESPMSGSAAPLRKVVVFGFRASTVEVIESLVCADSSAEVLVIVDDDRARGGALDDFDAHGSSLFGVRRESFKGRFVPEGTSLRYEPVEPNGDDRGRVWLATGDWTSSRLLCRLPHGFGAIHEADLVLMVASEEHDSDARVSAALIKVDALRDEAARAGCPRRRQRIVAEVRAVDLAERLTKRAKDMGRGEDVRVLATQELRAWFMVQATRRDGFVESLAGMA